MTKDNSIYLGHIKEAIANIISFVQNIDRENFLENRLVQDATIRNLEIIGEASKYISFEFRDNHPEIEWKKMAGMRDRLIHQYMGVDTQTILNLINMAILKIDHWVKLHSYYGE